MEIMIDSRRAASIDDLHDFLAQSKIGFRVVPIELDQMTSWHVRDGALSHESGGFFSIAGVQFERERSHQRILLYQPQSAITGLLTCMIEGQRHFLLQARAEPGNAAKSQFGPTVQSTPANYLRTHGGTTSPYIEMFTTHQASIQVLHDSMQLDYGERYLFKSKRLIVAQCDQNIPIQDGFIWVPAHLMSALVAQSNFSTFDLRSLLVMCDWLGTQVDALRPASPAVCFGLHQPLRPERLGQALAELQGQVERYRMCDLSRMDNWIMTERGLQERSPRQGFCIGYYDVEVKGREVAHWSQPLISSNTQGHASLLCRVVDDSLEVNVRVAPESGLQTGKALLPSYLRYPGVSSDTLPPVGHVLLNTIESDEGGRFFCDTSQYELIMVPDHKEVDGIWLRISELKYLLSKSNVCSIQLRALASLLLGQLSFDATLSIA